MHPKTGFLIFLLTGAALGGCAVPSQPPGSNKMLSDITQLKNAQHQLSQRVDQLQLQLQQLEDRFPEQQRGSFNQQQPAAEKGTTGWQKAEPGTPDKPSTSAQGSPTELYLQAFADYAGGRYPQAIKGFNAFIDSYPGNNYAGNAQYWLGECYYALEDYPRAVQELEKAAYQYPDSGKAPDALLKLIPTLRRLNRFEQAREAQQLLFRRYPDSPAAARARADN